ncbi:pyridoxamine 5'-phosphate oxidase family protein [Herbidospora yilanensis]|uniref:pyridoxamine 5'-phosphate oxidase family protein n=1 Tax=Herbidospora yilanensis TaxID=354426 RepID=UPI000785671A|nr:pyridoxamine 5'-phosphate oxidase family protein [Herbidospora yilanensis]
MLNARRDTGSSTLEELTEQECLQLVGPGGIGRVAFGGAAGPTVFPVNYRLVDGRVVFRIRKGGTMDQSLQSGIDDLEVKIAFQVDHVDEESREGWSVLIQGPAHHVTEDELRAASADVESWAGDDRDHYVRIAPQRVTGRRINRI